MQDFVIGISKYAKSINQNFVIIPQNGIELCFNNTELSDGINYEYLNAVDGFGIEELFYDGKLDIAQEKLSMLNYIKNKKAIFVSEYIDDNNYYTDAINRNYSNGFIPFIRIKNNYDYSFISDNITNVNTNDINTLSDVKNYLYLINFKNFISKEDLINRLVNNNYDLLIIDAFFNNVIFTKEEIEKLKIKANGHKRLVIAYVNIGSAEKFRYYWNNNWKLGNPIWIKKSYEGYSDEFWVEFWNAEWQNIIYGNDNAYINKVLSSGFDGAYLDNVEGYYFLYK